MKWWKTMLKMMLSPILVLKKEKHLKTDYGKNKIHIVNDTDKILGLANADKCDVIGECKDNCLMLQHTASYLRKK